jgi:hypothetical protein
MMKKQLLSLFIIWTILLTGGVNFNLSGQTVSKDTASEVSSQNAETNSPDKSQSLSKKNLKLLDSAVSDNQIDFEKIENERSKNLSKQKMSGKRKAMWAAVIIGGVVGMFFLIKYAKECEIYESYCPTDEVCPCLKYRDRN